MGNVTVKSGIGFSSHTGAQYIDMAAAKGKLGEGSKPSVPVPAKRPTDAPFYPEGTPSPWSNWGNNNLLPQEMVADIESTGILNAIIEGRARFATCQGMLPAIVKVQPDGTRTIEKIVDDPEIKDFMDMNMHFLHTFGWMKDYIGFHRCLGRIMLTKDRKKIATFQRDDVSEARLQKKDTRGRIANVYYSAEWNKVISEQSPYVFNVPLLNPFNPFNDLSNRIQGGDKAYEFAMTVAHPGWSKHYYPVPLWYAAYKWVKIAQSVPEMKAALYQNSMRAKYMVIIQESYWGHAFGSDWDKYTEDQKEEKRKKVFDEIDEHLVGSENAGKAMFTTGYRDRDGKIWSDIEIKTIDDTTKQGEYLPDSAAANSEIAFASLFNPAIIGASLPSGPYTNSGGGSDIRESVLVQIVLHELERQQIRSLMNVIKYYNGWNQKYPGLEFIIPATILTTLDTGSGSKQVVTGNAQPGQKNNNSNNPDNKNSDGAN